MAKVTILWHTGQEEGSVNVDEVQKIMAQIGPMDKCFTVDGVDFYFIFSDSEGFFGIKRIYDSQGGRVSAAWLSFSCAC